jgi:hypothetical protein
MDAIRRTFGRRTHPSLLSLLPSLPLQVLFSQKLKWAPSSAGQDIKESFRRRLLPGIEVRYITEPSHVLKGQYGACMVVAWEWKARRLRGSSFYFYFF